MILLEAGGWSVQAVAAPDGRRPLCCGRTYLSAGMLDEARAEARRLLEALNSDEDQKGLMDVRELLALERESYIFMALVGGNTSRSILVSALKEYGHAESDLYQLTKSQEHMVMRDFKLLLKD